MAKLSTGTELESIVTSWNKLDATLARSVIVSQPIEMLNDILKEFFEQLLPLPGGGRDRVVRWVLTVSVKPITDTRVILGNETKSHGKNIA